MGHQVKDRALQMRLERAADENERLRVENQTLRESMEESRDDHRRIMDLLESRPAADEDEGEGEGRSRAGRRFLFLLLLAGGAWAWMRSMADRRATGEDWGAPPRATGPGDAGMAA
jgi:hypothetical protein